MKCISIAMGVETVGILDFVPFLSGILDKIIPDKNARAQAKEALENMEAQGELELLKGQLTVNSNEATHSSVFVAGWRPAVGWVCAFIFGYHYLLYPLLVLILTVNGVDLKGVPAFDSNSIWPVLSGMLGLGGMRTYEKKQGVARK